jgi:hypothetical protein
MSSYVSIIAATSIVLALLSLAFLWMRYIKNKRTWDNRRIGDTVNQVRLEQPPNEYIEAQILGNDVLGQEYRTKKSALIRAIESKECPICGARTFRGQENAKQFIAQKTTEGMFTGFIYRIEGSCKSCGYSDGLDAVS